MILRVRSRDGLERVSVQDSATVADLVKAIQEQLKLPADQPLVLSKNQGLLIAKDGSESSYSDFSDPRANLSAIGLKHGDVIFLWYSLERKVEPPKVAVVPAGTFGKKMTVDDLVARQIRIERQEEAHCTMLSFDRAAANEFQLYVNETLGFSIQRGGIMYGSCDEAGEVRVEFIYEPPQTGTESSLLFHRDQAEEQCVEAIAAGLGLRKVGVIFTRSAAQSGDEDRNYTLSTSELRLAAELHAEALGLTVKRGGDGDEAMPDAFAANVGAGIEARKEEARKEAESEAAGFKQFAVGVVSLTPNEEGTSDVHFEAFQLSDQCVRLFAKGLFADIEDPGAATEPAVAAKESKGSAEGERGAGGGPGVTRMRREVIVVRKDTFEVDNDFFLVAVGISDHEGMLKCLFPVENRVVHATERELKTYLEKTKSVRPFSKKLADFHLLLFLSHILDPVNDIPVLAEAVRIEGPVPEGYELIIESF